MVFYNEKYVGLIFENSKGDTPYKMEVYSLSGEKIMSKEIEMNLDHVKFAGKNVLMYDDVTCELISLKGVVKFKHVFTKQLDAIVPMESTNTFLLMTKNKIEEISLRYSLKSPVTKNKQTAEAKEMCKRVLESGDYYKALLIISEYVETELSPPPKENKKTKKKNQPER